MSQNGHFEIKWPFWLVWPLDAAEAFVLTPFLLILQENQQKSSKKQCFLAILVTSQGKTVGFSRVLARKHGKMDFQPKCDILWHPGRYGTQAGMAPCVWHPVYGTPRKPRTMPCTGTPVPYLCRTVLVVGTRAWRHRAPVPLCRPGCPS